MSDLYLRSGIFLAPFHNHDENPTLSIERDLELLEHLDRLNYHEAWIGEHHSGGFELIACPEMFIAAAAQRTRHIRLGTGVVSLPYHNPFMVADRMVQLDHMTRGRAMFGVGPGALVHDALKIGIDPGDQRQMMNEALDVIVPLLRGETVNRKTDWFNLTDAQLQLRPYTQPTMELAVAAARSPSGSLAVRQDTASACCRSAAPRRRRWSATRRTGTSTRRPRAPTAMCPTAGTGASSASSTSPRRASRRRKNVQFGVQAFADYFRDVATFPIIPPDVANPAEWLIETGTGLHRHARRRDRLCRAAGRGLGRVRRALRTGAELGRLGRDKAALRIDGALCAPAFPDRAGTCCAAATITRSAIAPISSARPARRSRRRSTATPRTRGRRPKQEAAE